MTTGRAAREHRAELRAGLRYDRALDAMRRGKVLRLEHRNGRPSWFLDYDQTVHPEAAALLIQSLLIEAADDTLFPGVTPGQTWRIRR